MSCVLRKERLIHRGEPVVFITPEGQIRMAVAIKKVTMPGWYDGMIKMLDYAEVYILNEKSNTNYRQLYTWGEFIELNREFEVRNGV